MLRYLRRMFMGENMGAQNVTCLKSHQKGMKLGFRSRHFTSNCLDSFNTNAFQMHFLNPKSPLKIKWHVEIQHIKQTLGFCDWSGVEESRASSLEPSFLQAHPINGSQEPFSEVWDSEECHFKPTPHYSIPQLYLVQFSLGAKLLRGILVSAILFG